MKNHKLLAILLFLFSIFSFSQSNSKDDKIKALKVSFITNALSLTSDEAARFWPIYNVYDDKQFDLKHSKMKTIRKKLSSDTLDKMTDAEAASILVQIQKNEDELYQNQKNLMSNLKGVLSPIKILKLKKAEVDFNRTLLRQYRNKNQNK